MKKEKIAFFKMGRFPLISESHITNKIVNITRFSPIVICSELNDTPEGKPYLKKLEKTRIISFRRIKDNPKENKSLKCVLRKFAKKIGLNKLIKFTELSSPDLIIGMTLSVFKMISEINISLHNKKSMMNFFHETIKKEGINVIDGCYGWEIIPISILKRKLRFRTILSIRGKDLAIIKKYRCIRKITLENADLLITRSDYMRKELLSLGFSKKKVFVNHSGCDIKLFSPGKKKLDSHKGKMRMITVGRLVEKKGHIYLLEACRILKDRKIDFFLTIIGDGPLKKDLEEFIKHNELEDNVKMMGEISNDEVPKKFKENDIFVLPSIVTANQDSEGIPVSLMEAMASGLVCISTRSIGIPELIDDNINGFLVNEKDSEDIVEKIISISNNPKISGKIRFFARTKIEREFNSKIQSERFEDLLSKRT